MITILQPYTGQPVLARCSKILQYFVGAKFYSPHATADGKAKIHSACGHNRSCQMGECTTI